MTITISDPFRIEVKAPPALFVTFASSVTEGGLVLQAAAPSRATLVNIGRDGPTAVRLHTEPGDNNLFGSGDSERCDLTSDQPTTDGFEGREHWWAHSILFPTDYIDPPAGDFAVVFDFHNTTAGPGQANFNVDAMPATQPFLDRPTGLNFRGYGGSFSSPIEFKAPIGPIVRNVWYDFVYNVRWSSSSDGFFKAWVNGALKLDHPGPTLYAGQGVYFKLANYHSPFGLPSSVIHDRIIRGATWQEVSLTPLEGVS